MWAHLGILVAAAIAAGCATGLAARAWLRTGQVRVLTASFAAALLAALVAGELTIRTFRRWSADRPLTAATAIGLLLLTLTVIVLEAVVNEIFTRTEQRRWRSAAKAAAAILMSGVSTAMAEFQRTALWSATVAVESFQETAPEVDSDAVQLGSAMTRAVLDVAGILTATAELHALHEHAVAAAGAARELPAAVRDWSYAHAGNLSLPTLESETARLSWWSGVMPAWDRIVGEMTAFQTVAERELGLFSDTQYAWELTGPTEYERARHAYLHEYG